MNKKISLVLHNCKFGDEEQRSFDMGNFKPADALIEQLVRHFDAEHATIEEKYVPKKNTGGFYIGNKETIHISNLGKSAIPETLSF